MGLKTREFENMIREIMLAIRYSPSHLASSDNEDDVEDKECEDTELAKLS